MASASVALGVLLVALAPLAAATEQLHPRVRVLVDELQRQRAQQAGGSSADECLVTSAKYGARCDGVANDTLAIQQAIDGCSGVVSLPDGETCLTHSLALRNGSQFKIPGNGLADLFLIFHKFPQHFVGFRNGR